MDLPKSKNWNIKEPDQKLINELSSNLFISSFLSSVLINRGITDVESGRKFLFPKYEDLYDPFLLPDMDKAIERIEKAIKDREHIMVYGDYDCDGTTATSVLLNALELRGAAKVGYHIPNRFTDGYGINKPALTEIRKQGYTLLITVDCGVTAIVEVAYANFLGLDTIITDHHLPDVNRVPDALALITPHAVENDYPFKDLAGVGLAFKLASGFIDNKDYLHTLLDMVTIGTIVDVAPLTGENRTITKLGLNQLNDLRKPRRPGIRSLCSVANQGRTSKLTGYDFSFGLGPRINAAGRMGKAEMVVELLMSDSYNKAEKIAQELDNMNVRRKEYQKKIYEDAVSFIKKDNLDKDNAIVVAHDWGDRAKGVVGIVAANLMEKFNKPVVLLTINDEKASGSGRADDTINLSEALLKCSDVLSSHGGHAAAAGLSLDKNDIGEFRDKLNKYAEENMDDQKSVPELNIDYELDFNDINNELIEEISLLQPCGHKNRYPLVKSINVEFPEGTDYLGKTKDHLQFMAEQYGTTIKGLQWRSGKYKELLDKDGLLYNVAYHPELHTWMGKTNLRISVEDWKIHDSKKVIKAAKDLARSTLMKQQTMFLEKYGFYVADVYEAFKSMIGTDPDTWTSEIWDTFTEEIKFCQHGTKGKLHETLQNIDYSKS